MNLPGFHQVFYFSQNFTKPGEFTRLSPNFHQVFNFAQNVTKPDEFTRCSRGFTRFFIFHKMPQNLMNLSGIHQVFLFFHKIPQNLMNLRGFHHVYFSQNSTEPGEFTRFWPGFTTFSIFTKLFHKPDEFTRFSPRSLIFHQIPQNLVDLPGFHQGFDCTLFPKKRVKSQGFHQVFDFILFPYKMWWFY